MNTVFKVVFNVATRAFTAVSEAAKSKHVSLTVVTGLQARLGVISMVTALAVPFVGTSAIANEVDPAPYNQKDALTVDSVKSAIVGKVNMLDGLTTYRLDGRGNETASEAFKGNESSKNSIHYDNEGLVETGKNKTDDNGVAWHGQFKDSEGNDTPIKELKWQQSDRSSITFAGAKGTTLKNVAPGVVGTDAVNVDQLDSVNQTAKAAQKNANTNSDTIGALNTRVTKTEGDVAAVSKTANDAAIDAKNADAKAVKASKEATSAQSTANTGLSTGNTAMGVANVAKIRTDQLEKSKVDNTTFVADQFRQDAQADADRTNTRKELDTKVNVDTYMNQLQTDQAKTTQAQASADTANASVSRETVDRESQFSAGVAAQAAINDQVLSETKRLDTVKADKTQVNAVIDSVDAVATETRAHGDKIQSLDSRTSAVETQTSANSNAINANAARQSEINEDVEARKADRSELKQAVTNQSKVNDEVSQVQTSHGQRINTLEDRQGNTEQAITAVNANAIARDKEVLSDAKSYVDRTRGELNNRIDNVERKAYSGIAASMAMTGLSPVIHANKSAMAVSVGSYASQGAVAVGYSRRFGDDATTLRINGAVADRNFGGAVGITHEF